MMSLLLGKLGSSVGQIIVFSLAPVLWYLITARKKENVFSWLGFKKIEKDNRKKVLIACTVLAAVFMAIGVYVLIITKDAEKATSDFDGLKLSAIPAILVYALINTSLPEEILFRGFLLKRLSNKFGFVAANFIQAIIFGLLHGAMFVSMVGVVKAFVVIAFTGMIGWFMGYINEKKANGSIFASWGIHAAANIFSGICSAFCLF